MWETLAEIRAFALELIKGCTVGFAELSHNRAKDHGFPKSWFHHVVSALSAVAGFGFGTLVISIGAATGILVMINNRIGEKR